MTTILFDCDGVLVDTERPQMAVLAALVQEWGGRLTAEEALHLQKGQAMPHHLALIAQRLGRPIPPDTEQQLRQRWSQAFARGLAPLAGAHELLTHLEQLGLPKAVVSNGPRAKMEETLTLAGLRPYFGPHLYSAWDIGRWKPDPAPYLHAAAQLGANPTACLVVEDSVPGVQAAVAAGMRVVGLAQTELEAAELTDCGAAVVFRGRLPTPRQFDQLRMGDWS